MPRSAVQESGLQRVLDRGMSMSLSSDVECTMTADMFTQMRSLMTLQRMHVNDKALGGETDYPKLMQPMDAIRHATIEGARRTCSTASRRNPARRTS